MGEKEATETDKKRARRKKKVRKHVERVERERREQEAHRNDSGIVLKGAAAAQAKKQALEKLQQNAKQGLGVSRRGKQ